MSREMLMGVVMVLLVGIGALGWSLYEEKKQPDGVEISVGRNGVSIQEK
mgnify:CR=1 FL=1